MGETLACLAAVGTGAQAGVQPQARPLAHHVPPTENWHARVYTDEGRAPNRLQWVPACHCCCCCCCCLLSNKLKLDPPVLTLLACESSHNPPMPCVRAPLSCRLVLQADEFDDPEVQLRVQALKDRGEGEKGATVHPA